MKSIKIEEKKASDGRIGEYLQRRNRKMSMKKLLDYILIGNILGPRVVAQRKVSVWQLRRPTGSNVLNRDLYRSITSSCQETLGDGNYIRFNFFE